MIHAYWFEDHKKLSDRVQEIHYAMQSRADRLCTSPFVLGELLAGPLRTDDFAAAGLIQDFFISDAVTMFGYPPQAAYVFATLRARDRIKAIDALHLAVAATAGVDLFLTHDRRLQKVIVPGIRFIASLETDLF